MAAYVIASVAESHDPDALAEYRRRNTEAVEAAGGRFLVRGGAVEPIEGSWDPLRVVIMAFDDMDAARGWYRSDLYRPLIGIRQGASTTDIILVEGV